MGRYARYANGRIKNLPFPDPVGGGNLHVFYFIAVVPDPADAGAEEEHCKICLRNCRIILYHHADICKKRINYGNELTAESPDAIIAN